MKPKILSVSPDSGPIGTEVTIRGERFAQSGNKVYFGYKSYTGYMGSFDSSNNEIRFEIPGGLQAKCVTRICTMEIIGVKPGEYKITVSNNRGYSSIKFTVTVDETADWKTYRNEKYGFEMKYPADWEIKIFNVGGKYLFGIGFKPGNLTGETLANVFVSKEKLGLLAVQFEKQNNNFLFTLQNSGGSDYLSLEKKILSTFKFTP